MARKLGSVSRAKTQRRKDKTESDLCASASLRETRNYRATRHDREIAYSLPRLRPFRPSGSPRRHGGHGEKPNKEEESNSPGFLSSPCPPCLRGEPPTFRQGASMRLASRLGGVAVGAALLTPPAWSQDVQISSDTKLLGDRKS